MLAVTPALQIKPAFPPLPAARADSPLGGFGRVLDARVDSAKRVGADSSPPTKAETAPLNAQRPTPEAQQAPEAQQPRDESIGTDDDAAIDPTVDQSPDAGDSTEPTETDTEPSADQTVVATVAAASASQTQSTDAASIGVAQSPTAENTGANSQLIPNGSASSAPIHAPADPTAEAPPPAPAPDTASTLQQNQASAGAEISDTNTSKQVVTPSAGERTDQSKRAEQQAASNAAASDVIDADTPRAAPADPTTGSGADGQPGSGDSRAAREFIQDIARAAGDSGVNAATRSADGADESVAFRAQVSRGLEAALRHDGGSVTLRLKPDSLGPLRIDLQVHAGEVAASFRSSSREAHELLSTQLSSLRASLEAKGLSVRAMEVQPPPAPSGAQNDTAASRDPGAQQGAGHAGSDASHGSDTGGHANSRREDPADLMNTRASVALAEAEPTTPGWVRVGMPGALDAVA